jgi:hypothetical protein
MLGIPRDVAEHSLDIRAGARPVKQPLRRFDEEKRRAIGEEIHKLMAAGFIKEVFHPEWLANPVLVKKKGGKWRMCVDYTSLNKACPKVPYPLPRIDQIVDSTAGCETLSFLDAYSGYHQIKMKESDQLATSLITPFGMYCYTTMSFGYPSPKGRSYCKRYTRGLAVTMQHLEPSSGTPSDKASTGRPRWPMPLGLCAPARGVNSTRDRRTCPLRPCRQYPSPGCLLCGVWTSSVPCRRHPRASRTCWSPSTNSPSGSRSDP